MRISVIGLGKLGSPLAVTYADAGHDVVGFDTNPDVLKRLREGRAPVEEPQLQAFIDRARERLDFVDSIAEAVAASDISCIIVPTPSSPDGSFSLDLLLPAVEALGEAIRAKDQRHCVVITSTVMPGHTDGPIKAALERTAGKSVGDELGLCYNPEFIALGSVIHDMQYPDLVLIGGPDDWSTDLVAALGTSICKSNPHVARLSTVDAEIAKLAVNTFVTTKISYANMLAEMCERLPGASATRVAGAIGHDRRIGPSYLRPGSAYGGPCFPRDNVALSTLARSLGVQAELAEATHRTNKHQTERLVAQVTTAVSPGDGSVAVLGLSYKPGTPVAEEAAGVLLAQRLVACGYKVSAYDPLAGSAAAAALPEGVTLCDSAIDAASDAAVVIIATPWPEFARLTSADLSPGGRPMHVIDCWGVLDGNELNEAVTRVAVGEHSPGWMTPD